MIRPTELTTFIAQAPTSDTAEGFFSDSMIFEDYKNKTHLI